MMRLKRTPDNGSTSLMDANRSRSVIAMSKEYSAKHEVGWHSHKKAQLIYAVAGVMEVQIAGAVWLIPPQRALWMPPKMSHYMRARGSVSLRTIYVSATVCPSTAPASPRPVHVSPLLRELIIRATTLPSTGLLSAGEQAVFSLLIHEINWINDHSLYLPTPQDKRLKALCAALMEAPGSQRTLEQWATHVGASPRTLARLFHRELGCGFTTWRRQLRALTAVTRLGAGEPVKIVASEAGYETAGAFAEMFNKVMGRVPSRYFSEVPHSTSEEYL